MNYNIILADFDDREWVPYLDNRRIEIKFDKYQDCLDWIKEHTLKHENYTPHLFWKCEFGDYHKSWDWLMPVVNKLLTGDYNIPAYLRRDLEKAILSVNIQDTLVALVYIIKFKKLNSNEG